MKNAIYPGSFDPVTVGHLNIIRRAAEINHKINPDLDTMFLTAEHQYTYLSSSMVKELGRYRVDLTDFLPEDIIPDFQKRICSTD